MLGYGRQTIEQADVDAVVATLRGDYLTQGPAVERFEAALAERVGARYAVAVANGTAGLHIAALAAGIGAGKRGVTSTLTFVASANCLLYCGGDAGVVDIDPVTLCMSPASLQTYLAGQNCDAVVTVDFAGLAADSAELRRIAGSRIVIEDACHALGGTYESGRPVGCGDHADMTVFSFHPVKPITTAEGGAVMTNDPELARRLRLLRSHGIERDPAREISPVTEGGKRAPWYYEAQLLGFNYRMNDLQAALGHSQLARLDAFAARRREIALRYDAELKGIAHLTIPHATPEMRKRSGLHLYVVHADWPSAGTTRTAFMSRLAAAGIGTQVHYIPVHRQPLHQARLSARPEDFPAAERHYAQALSLPLFPSMTDSDVDTVVRAVREGLGG